MTQISNNFIRTINKKSEITNSKKDERLRCIFSSLDHEGRVFNNFDAPPCSGMAMNETTNRELNEEKQEFTGVKGTPCRPCSNALVCQIKEKKETGTFKYSKETKLCCFANTGGKNFGEFKIEAHQMSAQLYSKYKLTTQQKILGDLTESEDYWTCIKCHQYLLKIPGKLVFNFQF